MELPNYRSLRFQKSWQRLSYRQIRTSRPVLVDITKNAQFDKFEFSYKKCTGIRSYVAVPKLNIDKVKEAAELINMLRNHLLLWSRDYSWSS
jgi:thiamine pyrophosphate-dependent acetolactate synthase large subunit-like protein